MEGEGAVIGVGEEDNGLIGGDFINTGKRKTDRIGFRFAAVGICYFDVVAACAGDGE